jgi:hypothetical protein
MKSIKPSIFLLLGIALAALNGHATGRTVGLDPNPNPCDPVCIDPIDPPPVTVYAVGQRGINPLPLWVDGVLNEWSPGTEYGRDIAADGDDLYTAATGGSTGVVVRKNAAIVYEYPVIPLTAFKDLNLWLNAGDIYLLDRRTPLSGGIVTGRLYRNTTVLQEFQSGFDPSDVDGMVDNAGAVRLVVGGTVASGSPSADRAAIYKNGALLLLSQSTGSAVNAVRYAKSGWIHAVGKIGAQAAYWRISPTNVVTQTLLTSPRPTANSIARDIHIGHDGTVYVAGQGLFLNAAGNPSSQNAVVWVNGHGSILPTGDMIGDGDSAYAVTSDAYGNYYVGGSWNDTGFIQGNAFIGVIWKNGQLHQIVEDPGVYSSVSGLVVK